MAEISLSAYQEELESLLTQNRFDEVIAHARHILKTFPKNLRAYRQLGDALVATSRWAEATGVLRRTLGAQPQDFQAHSQLAQSYRQLEQSDKAIWHAERALDQQPSDQDTISLIRQLYREHRNQEIDRLQLTAGALAQQHIRGNLLTEALDTLATALKRSPDRIDLQLLQARALWLDGQRMDAAEAALDILERLPYAIDANRIMTELWLAEQRPSDAQIYLKRIEDLDPDLAHQLAAGEPPPESMLMIDELDYSSISPREGAIVNPEWLDNLGETRVEDAEEEEEGAGGLGALFGIDDGESTPEEEDVTADLEDLLSDEQIDRLFSELVIGEPVAAVSDVKPNEDKVEQLLTSMEEKGFIEASASAADDGDGLQLADDHEDLGDIAAQLSAEDDADEEIAADDLSDEMDSELASLLERLDSADENGDWMAEIQQGSLDQGDGDESLKYLNDFDREWVQAGEDEEAGGAPWLSAAMRETMDQDEDEDFSLFGDDEQLQNLLNRASDTEPIHLSDIEDWLNEETDEAAEGAGERYLDIEDELLHSPPAGSWLDSDEETGGSSILSTAEDDDPNQRNANLIDSWQSELGDDDDDDPYVDWLSDDPNELGIVSAQADEELSATAAPADEGSSAVERARAWGLDDADQLADFVEEDGGGAAGSPDWLNAMVPGLDRENDASTDDVDEYARPMSAPGKEFAWVSDIVEEETGEMKAVDPDAAADTPYFRFSNPPAWLTIMQERANGGGDGSVLTGVTALSLDENIQALNLDDLTFDDYFNFDTPTDKLDVINLDEDTQKLNFVGLDWDDYFDLESPTEKTIAITIDEDPGNVDFDELGIDDENFDFENSTGEVLDAGGDFNFDDVGLGAADSEQPDPDADAPPTWLKYDGLGDDDLDADDPNRRSGQTTL